jgi:hypothetical protein
MKPELKNEEKEDIKINAKDIKNLKNYMKKAMTAAATAAVTATATAIVVRRVKNIKIKDTM